MSSDAVKTVRDLVSLVRGTTYKGDLVGKPGPALLGLGAIQPGGGFRETDFKTYGGDCPAKLMLVPGDLFASLKGATKDGKMIGSIARVPHSVASGRLTQDTVKLQFHQPNKAMENYLYWVLRSPQYRGYCAGRAMGSAVVAMSREDFLSYEIPPLTLFRSEAVELLEEIEKRERLLRETNATLESIAQALFKSWFVDFDPVRAKQEGRAPDGMDEATAALFPDGFEESELGLVPRGWVAMNFGKVVSLHNGSIQTGPFGSQLHASDYSGHGIPVVMPKDISNRRIDTVSIARVSNEHVERLSRYQLKVGDIVFSRRGDVERHALVTRYEAGWLCGTGCLLVRLGSSWRWSAYLSMLLDAPQARAWLVQHAVGATMPNLNTGILGSVPLVLPPVSILDQFEQVVMALEKSRSENFVMLSTHSALRDTLLPRLISGHLSLPEAEVQVAEAIA